MRGIKIMHFALFKSPSPCPLPLERDVVLRAELLHFLMIPQVRIERIRVFNLQHII